MLDEFKEIQKPVFESLLKLGRFKEGPNILDGWHYGTLANGSAVKACYDKQVQRQRELPRA